MSVPTRLIDTHLHLADRDSLACAWLGSELALAARDRTYELSRGLAGDVACRIGAAVANGRPEAAGFAVRLYGIGWQGARGDPARAPAEGEVRHG